MLRISVHLFLHFNVSNIDFTKKKKSFLHELIYFSILAS